MFLSTYFRCRFALIINAYFLALLTFNGQAAVILQYHHVSDTTPTSTSISPKQFNKHLQYLADNDFTVVALSTLIEAIKNKQALNDKTVAITFDDAYLNILTNAKPLLDKFNYPFTIFINPASADRYSDSFLSWQQLKELADDNVIIANHNFEHDSLARIPEGLTEKAWLKKQGDLILAAEQVIKEKTGKSWRYFAYPYGEYSKANQDWLTANNFIAFGQQSGAVGFDTDLSNIPRFPAAQPYDKLTSLVDKLHSLPFSIKVSGPAAGDLFKYGELTGATFVLGNNNINNHQVSCYVSNLGRQELTWLDEKTFAIKFSKTLPSGRVKINCTAPNREDASRYHWFSKVWMVLEENGQWYPL
ncbi:MAG: polysaccharide deacetylase family protein [Thalassotalea sp.]